MARAKLDRSFMSPDPGSSSVQPMGGLSEETADDSLPDTEPSERITHDPWTESLPPTDFITAVRSGFGVTREFFARMTGFSVRAISGWEAGRPLSEAALRRIKEMKRFHDALTDGIRAEFIARWLETPCEGLGGLKPVEILERGETDRLWRTVLLIGSGMPT
jgi:DNA-binding transcriptional regulator YiaG